MTLNPKNYLIIGITENWHRAFEHNPPVWGFTEREKSAWDSFKSGDILYFYAAKEARGIIGKGIMLNKFQSNDPYWRKEIETGVAKWRLHFYIQPYRLLPPDMWHARKGPVPSSEFDILGSHLQGKQSIPLNANQVAKIDQRISEWPVVAVGSSQPVKEEPSIIGERPPVYTPRPHTELISMVEKMGGLQNFYPQTEFSIPDENRRIDVVWRREVRGTPTYAFEIELSGGLDKALNKLYKCFRLWNTLPRIIADSSEFNKIQNIASSLESNFEVVPITPSQIQDIYKRKLDFKELEKGVKLL